jgi:hypothetical protein
MVRDFMAAYLKEAKEYGGEPGAGKLLQNQVCPSFAVQDRKLLKDRTAKRSNPCRLFRLCGGSNLNFHAFSEGIECKVCARPFGSQSNQLS